MGEKLRVVAMATLVVLLAACSRDETNRAGALAAGPSSPDVWTTQLDDGTVVRVRPEAGTVQEGRTTFLIDLDPPPVGAPAITVDLLSPTMPAHGVTRYDAVAAGSGRFRAEADIPMAGDWSLYVNLDDGETAAPFSFVVAPAADTAGGRSSESHMHPAERR